MSWDFDLEAAINQIATFEDAITTPTPGVKNAYTYGNNPVEITDPTALPAVVHVPLGPQTAAPGSQPGLLALTGTYQLEYQIQSTMLILETVLDQYPGEESASNLFWKSVAEKFFNYDNRVTLVAQAGTNVHTYRLDFPARSYDVRPWPQAGNVHFYWSLQYTHTFTFVGG
jgi:hypothetical protein